MDKNGTDKFDDSQSSSKLRVPKNVRLYLSFKDGQDKVDILQDENKKGKGSARELAALCPAFPNPTDPKSVVVDPLAFFGKDDHGSKQLK